MGGQANFSFMKKFADQGRAHRNVGFVPYFYIAGIRFGANYFYANFFSITYIILLTARADSESQMLGYKLGADAYLPKPFEMEMLLSVIQNQMRNREYIKSRYRGNQFILSPQEATFSNADEQFMIKLNEMIDQNLSQPDLDVKFLTAQMAMSRTSLYNKVKELTGMGANDYINRRRIDKAIILLTQSDMSITEISEQVGFTYQRYFSTLFKEMKGMTPSQFRAQHGSTQQQSE